MHLVIVSSPSALPPPLLSLASTRPYLTFPECAPFSPSRCCVAPSTPLRIKRRPGSHPLHVIPIRKVGTGGCILSCKAQRLAPESNFTYLSNIYLRLLPRYATYHRLIECTSSTVVATPESRFFQRPECTPPSCAQITDYSVRGTPCTIVNQPPIRTALTTPSLAS
jgi:hypothetical protein